MRVTHLSLLQSPLSLHFVLQSLSRRYLWSQQDSSLQITIFWPYGFITFFSRIGELGLYRLLQRLFDLEDLDIDRGTRHSSLLAKYLDFYQSCSLYLCKMSSLRFCDYCRRLAGIFSFFRCLEAQPEGEQFLTGLISICCLLILSGDLPKNLVSSVSTLSLQMVAKQLNYFLMSLVSAASLLSLANSSTFITSQCYNFYRGNDCLRVSIISKMSPVGTQFVLFVSQSRKFHIFLKLFWRSAFLCRLFRKVYTKSFMNWFSLRKPGQHSYYWIRLASAELLLSNFLQSVDLVLFEGQKSPNENFRTREDSEILSAVEGVARCLAKGRLWSIILFNIIRECYKIRSSSNS